MARNGTMATFEDRLDSLKESMRNLVDYGSDIKDRAVDASKTGISKMGSLIKDHPIIAIGVAFGIGYLAMRVLRR